VTLKGPGLTARLRNCRDGRSKARVTYRPPGRIAVRGAVSAVSRACPAHGVGQETTGDPIWRGGVLCFLRFPMGYGREWLCVALLGAFACGAESARVSDNLSGVGGGDGDNGGQNTDNQNQGDGDSPGDG